jgi:Tfp pilus assembly protein PilF
MVLLGLRIARATGDRNAEASLSMLLRNKFPNTTQARAAESDTANQK